MIKFATCVYNGYNESTIKLITEPINHTIDNCGRSDCKSKCGSCVEIETINEAHAPCKEDTNDSMSSKVTIIVYRASDSGSNYEMSEDSERCVCVCPLRPIN